MFIEHLTHEEVEDGSRKSVLYVNLIAQRTDVVRRGNRYIRPYASPLNAMPRTCTICAHAKRPDIDKALVERQPFRAIARQHGVSKDALIRHHDDHLPTALVKAQAAREAADADALLA